MWWLPLAFGRGPGQTTREQNCRKAARRSAETEAADTTLSAAAPAGTRANAQCIGQPNISLPAFYKMASSGRFSRQASFLWPTNNYATGDTPANARSLEYQKKNRSHTSLTIICANTSGGGETKLQRGLDHSCDGSSLRLGAGPGKQHSANTAPTSAIPA